MLCAAGMLLSAGTADAAGAVWVGPPGPLWLRSVLMPPATACRRLNATSEATANERNVFTSMLPRWRI